METVGVEFGERSYHAIVAPGLLEQLGGRVRELLPDARCAFIAIDSGLPDRFVERAGASLAAAGFTVSGADVIPQEREKSLGSCELLLAEMANQHLDRSDVLIALGGGLTGDLAGFAASTYKRGIAFIQCPTTLLAMVDASVGGKTGVNLVTASGLTKNMVGAFWQPKLVLADLDTLTTLPPRVFRAGWGEMLKHGLIAGAFDPTLWRDTIESLSGDPVTGPSLDRLIARNIRLKASIVGDDERETASSSVGGRALLNLGHTFAHAIETIPHLTPDGVTGHAPLQHGEAVALGLVASAATSQALGLCSTATVERVRIAVERLGIRSRLDAMPDDDSLLDAMLHDKKVAGGRLRVIVPLEAGGARVVDSPTAGAIASGWSAIRVS